MPKKTKKEKIIAELRRQAGTVPPPQNNEKMKPKLNKTNELHEQARGKTQYHLDLDSKVVTHVEETHETTTLSKDTIAYAYISHDILRTIILTLLAFVFEAMVYWLIQHNTLTKFF